MKVLDPTPPKTTATIQLLCQKPITPAAVNKDIPTNKINICVLSNMNLFPFHSDSQVHP